jgi:glycosyltransferase involved in cell wall biosynthesis
MRMLCVAPLFSSIRDFVLGRGEPQGMPGFYRFLHGMEAKGHELHVIFRTEEQVMPKVSDQVFFYAGNTPARWRDRLRGKFCLDVLSATSVGLRLSRRLSFDVVYGHLAYGAAAGFLLGRLLGIRNATRQYGSLLHGQYGPSRWRILRGNTKAALPFLLPADHWIITQDGTRADRVARLFGTEETKLHIWFNGFDQESGDCDDEGSIRWPLPDGAKSLLWLGRLQGWKRPDRAINLLQGVLQMRPDTHLVFVGSGDWVPKLESAASELGLSGHIHFMGAVPHKHVWSYYRRCDLFLSLLDYSNLSNTVIEAMASGCCVVALNEGDTGLLVRDGQTGFLLDKKSLETAPALVSRLLDDDRLRKNVGSQAQTFVQRHLPSWDERIAKEITLLENLAASRKGLSG